MPNSFLLRSFLDARHKKLLRKLPNEFTVIRFAEAFRSLFKKGYREATILFGNETDLIKWISHYYLPRRAFAKRLKEDKPKGIHIRLSLKDLLKKIWRKV